MLLSLNGKLIETAFLVLHGHSEKMTDSQSLTEIIQNLHVRYATQCTRPALGE